jgi:hypothetical protein
MTQHHSPPSNGGEPRRLVALTHRDFRLIWLGQLFSNVGSEMQLIAINWHIFTLLRGQTYALSLFGRELN